MTIIHFAIVLLAGGFLTLVAGYFIVRSEGRKRDFHESVIFMRSLIESSELSLTTYRNILDAFHEFDTMSYRDKKVYKKLFSDFLFKYRDFLPESEQPKIKIIPDGTDGQYNYKIQIPDENIYANRCN